MRECTIWLKNCIKLDVNNVMKFEILFTKSQMYKYLFYNFTSITKIYAIQYNAIHYITLQ